MERLFLIKDDFVLSYKITDIFSYHQFVRASKVHINHFLQDKNITEFLYLNYSLLLCGGLYKQILKTTEFKF